MQRYIEAQEYIEFLTHRVHMLEQLLESKDSYIHFLERRVEALSVIDLTGSDDEEQNPFFWDEP